MCVFFFFKQKTAYEMRISDWSSDVCSSDVREGRGMMTACEFQDGIGMTDDRKPDRCVRHDCRRALAESRAEVAFWRDVYERAAYQVYLNMGHDRVGATEYAKLDRESRQREFAALSLEPNP